MTKCLRLLTEHTQKKKSDSGVNTRQGYEPLINTRI